MDNLDYINSNTSSKYTLESIDKFDSTADQND